MALFLFRFYPVLIPLIIYIIWLSIQRRRARKNGDPMPKFSDGPIFWLVISSLGIAILCFIFMGLSIESEKGVYTPPHMEGDRLVPARVER